QIDRNAHRLFVKPRLGVHHVKAHHDQTECAVQNMGLHLQATVALEDTIVNAERYRHADNEQETREHHVRQAHAVEAGRHVSNAVGDAVDTGHHVHKNHDQKCDAPEGVQRQIAADV